jgi:hypothetical protein
LNRFHRVDGGRLKREHLGGLVQFAAMDVAAYKGFRVTASQNKRPGFSPTRFDMT